MIDVLAFDGNALDQKNEVFICLNASVGPKVRCTNKTSSENIEIPMLRLQPSGFL